MWWQNWLGRQPSPDGEPRDALRAVALECARDLAERIPLPAETLAVLDLVCYRGLLRMIPKLRGLGVVGHSEFCRKLGLDPLRRAGPRALAWLVGLGLARKGGGAGAAWEIPVPVLAVCLHLKSVRGSTWWSASPPKPERGPPKFHDSRPMRPEVKASLAERRARVRAERKERLAQTKTPP